MSSAGASAAAALLLATACAWPFGPQPRPPTDEGDWADARDRATRSAKLYDGLSTDAFAHTVYLSPTVRETRARRLAVWSAMTVEEREGLLAAEREEAAKYDDFVVALFTPNRADNDLDAKPSVWRVALVSAEGEELPLEIQQLKTNATLRALYPFVTDFDVVYRVRFTRFPTTLAQRAFTLRLAGAKGRIDLVYAPTP